MTNFDLQLLSVRDEINNHDDHQYTDEEGVLLFLWDNESEYDLDEDRVINKVLLLPESGSDVGYDVTKLFYSSFFKCQ